MRRNRVGVVQLLPQLRDRLGGITAFANEASRDVLTARINGEVFPLAPNQERLCVYAARGERISVRHEHEGTPKQLVSRQVSTTNK